ncbi:AlpA family phage regulatory protein [Salmonella enterica]|nr:AlpA family phage regulatory protein [Salmonella enterica]ECC1579245.1 AlpA family phage regulatory protein [Salmonella enterica subsp. diarizonae]ECE6214319.1 DNA-binding protein [Salmonella enterica subsp. diarizonae]ECG1268898.1 DNA-binding protein [Salmonella enterica subsp. diarizonae]ECI5021760.1 DNA-binding protein [Salmonella enterica subsp. diarizonae]
MPKINNDRVVREKECRELTGLCRATRFLWEKKGKFPVRRNLGGRSVGWLLSEIQEWQNSQTKRDIE